MWQLARCCMLCPCPHLLLVIPLPRKYNVVPRREAGDVGSLKRVKPAQPVCLAPTQISVVFLWMLQCSGGVSPQKSLQGSRRSLPCILEEPGSGRRKTKLAKCISQSWQQYSANAGTAVVGSQIDLPVQPGFRNFGMKLSLAQKGSWPRSWLLWPCGLVFGILRCFKQEKL